MITEYDRAQQALERAMADEKLCITVIGHGFTEHVTLADWAFNHIQDNEVAIEVADRLLRYGTYDWNEDEPEFYVEFEVRHQDELTRQLVAFKIETRRSE